MALHTAWRGQGIAPGFLILLLIPADTKPWISLMMLATGFALAAFAEAWRKSLGVIVTAAKWLAPQPWPPGRFLCAVLPMPMAFLAAINLILMACLSTIGNFAVAGVVAAVGVAAGSLHWLVTVAERHCAERIPLVFLLHTGFVIAVAQALFPLVPLLLTVQLIWLVYRILRK